MVMIATLTGTVTERLGDILVLEVAGVGYGLLTTHTDSAHTESTKPVTFYIYEHIREDSHDLYGFRQLDTKQLFMQLLSVKNVGPKVAIAVLNIGSGSDIRQAISGGDIKFLQSAKGVGKRAAEQMVVELRDKVGLSASETAEGIVTRGGVNTSDEALQALVALGYSEGDAQKALEHIDPSLSVEERIKKALSGTS